VIRTQQVDAASLAQPPGNEVGVVPARSHPDEPGLERRRPVDLDADLRLRDEVAKPGGILLVRRDEENP